MSEQWKSGNVSGDDDVQMPLGVSSDTMKEESYAEPRPRMNTSTLGLFAAFGAALVALYLLGLQNKPRAASADSIARQEQTSVEIDRIIHDQKSGEKIESLLHDTKRLVAILMTYLESKPQAMVDMKNPWLVDMPVESGPSTAPPPPQVVSEDPILLAEYKELKALKVQMVMTGNPSRAMVSNKIVSVGSKFTLLTIKEITADGVVLTNGRGNDYQLKLNAPSIEKD